MNPHSDPDEGWADLARELGLESPSDLPASPPPIIEAVHLPFPTQNVDAYDAEDDTGFADFAEDDSTELETDSESESESDSEADEGEESTTPEGDEAPKKKKRRRRRRKKRAGTEIGQAPQSLAENETEQEDGDDDSEAEEESEEEEAAPIEADRGWANWDVPSWESIVLGLYRPAR